MIAELDRIGPLLSTARAEQKTVGQLEERLGHFYNTTNDYTAFRVPSEHTGWLKLVCQEIGNKFFHTRTLVRVLEAGAGLGSVFDNRGSFDRSIMHYTAQDITATVLHRLDQVADAVHFGPLETLQGQFDMVFSLFVLEHIAQPQEFLSHVNRLLVPGGTHIVICPRYDVPGYVCPSLRHLRPWQLVQVETGRLARNACTRYIGATPAFWVNTDPALFHRNWRRDSDAVHIVSQTDVIRWHRVHGYRARRMIPDSTGLRDFFLKRFATFCFAFDKAAPA